MKIYEHLTNNDFDNEIWKPINGYPNYMISNIGRVKSLYIRKYDVDLLTPIFRHDYLCVNLYKNGKSKNTRIHRLVATAFIENPDSKPQVNHKNGIKTDNCVDNLEWSTAKENSQHAWDNGLNENVRKASISSNIGENNGKNKLTDIECNLIRVRFSKGNSTQKELAEEFGCSTSQISRIINNTQRTNKTVKHDVG